MDCSGTLITMDDSIQDSRRVLPKSKTASGTVLGSSGRTAGKILKTDKEKREHEYSSERNGQKKMVLSANMKPTILPRKTDRDMRRFKVRYNTGIGNIMRNWMSLMYSILILRMHMIKFIFVNFPDMPDKNKQLSQQILLESKVIYHMIRKAQYFSQERSVFLWTHLEKLILNRMLLKNNLETARGREFSYRDWKGMAARLELMQAEFNKVQNLFNSLKADRNQREKMLAVKVQSLENLNRSKDEEMENLVEQITLLKKGELEVSCKILNNLKTCKDLNARKKHLINMERELKQLKNERNQMVREFSNQIKALKFGIQDTEREINVEKEEKKKLKKALKEFGNHQAEIKPKTTSETTVEN